MNQTPTPKKRVTVGRPPRNDTNQEEQEYQPKSQIYIADDSDCERLFSDIARQSNIKNVVKTGPKATQKKDLEIIETNKQLKQKMLELKVIDPHVFFLSQYQRKFKIVDDTVVDETEYQTISPPQVAKEEYKMLFDKVNVVARELDWRFIEILQRIIEHFITLRSQGQSKIEIINFILQEIEIDKTNYELLHTWSTLKLITKPTKIKKARQELIDKRQEVEKRSSEKIKMKHILMLKQQEAALDEEDKISPLKYLVTKLIDNFQRILDKSNLKEEADIEVKCLDEDSSSDS